VCLLGKPAVALPARWPVKEKKGSLLIIPLIRTDFNVVTGESWETLITIANDNYYSVEIQCVFVLKDEGCTHFNQYDFVLTANQPVTFRASDGYDLDGEDFLGGGIEKGHVAEAKCWAKRILFDDDDDNTTTSEISYNHLTAEVTLLREVNGVGYGAASYSAWRFAANAPPLTQVGTPGTLLLTGESNAYDSCPAALIFDLLKQTPTPSDSEYIGSVDNYVAIVPCKQDFSQDGGPASLKFDIYRRDENERSLKGALCVNCFVADSVANAPYFPGLTTPAGAFTAVPFVPTTCPYAGGTECNLPSGYIAYPAVGVSLKRFEGFLGPITAVTPTADGEWKADGACKGVAAVTFPE